MQVTYNAKWSVILLVCLSIILVMATPTKSAATPTTHTDTEQKFGILLDAGSSSTKLKVYGWKPPIKEGDLPSIDLIKSVRFSPGINTYQDDDSSPHLHGYLKNIIDSAKTEVPTEKHATTPIFLMATAGLRYDNAGDITHLLSRIEDIFKDSNTNPFLYSPGGATVLSGEEEGVYAWVALNYLLGFFDPNGPINEPAGLMEMGGASTQIAFIPKSPLLAEEFHVTLAGKLYQLYVQSYLDYGIDAMKEKIARHVLSQNPKATEVYSPCILKGDTFTTEQNIPVIGSGNPAECKDIIETLVAPDTGEECLPQPCAIGSHYQPDLSGIHFYATQGFTHAPLELGSLDKSNVLDMEKLLASATAYCMKSLQNVVDAGGDAQYVSNPCMMGLYIPALFTTSYGFPLNTTSISVVSDINGQNIDWALGAMLMQLSSTHTGDSQSYAVKRRRR